MSSRNRAHVSGREAVREPHRARERRGRRHVRTVRRETFDARVVRARAGAAGRGGAGAHRGAAGQRPHDAGPEAIGSRQGARARSRRAAPRRGDGGPQRHRSRRGVAAAARRQRARRHADRRRASHEGDRVDLDDRRRAGRREEDRAGRAEPTCSRRRSSSRHISDRAGASASSSSRRSPRSATRRRACSRPMRTHDGDREHSAHGHRSARRRCAQRRLRRHASAVGCLAADRAGRDRGAHRFERRGKVDAARRASAAS